MSRVEKLANGDEVLTGPDFHAAIEYVEFTVFMVRTERGGAMGITAAAIEAIHPGSP